MFIFNYISIIIVLCTNMELNLCANEEELGFDDILNPTSSTYSVATKSAEQTQEPTFALPDDKWLVNALQDIAYFLRNHKFNEWDRRKYSNKPKDIFIGFYNSFPDPSLRSLHWKVYKNCYKDFYQCVKYLYSVTETAPFTRRDDIITTLNKKENMSKIPIAELDNDCKKALLYSEKTGLPFDEPKEKFRWRTSASYFMCWYTMLGIPALSMLGESCDNFANCLDPTFGYRNHDPRSDDKFSFACALYSFCPDPCCPLKHVKTASQCYDTKRNPCFTENAQSSEVKYRQCRFDRKDNQNLEGIIANKWNISCHCKEKGFEWKSQFEMCVDVNECTTNKHSCHSVTENCINLPGTFQCICRWGYAYDVVKKRCVKKDILPKPNSKKVNGEVGFLDNLKYFLEYMGF